MFKKLAVICLALCLGLAMASCSVETAAGEKTEKAEKKTTAETEEEEEEENPGFEYKFSGTTAVLISYTGEDEVVDLTEPIVHFKKNKDSGEKEPHNYDLISVESGAFKNCETVKKIILPDTVETIGVAAFQGCTALEEVVLPAAITEIPDQLFYGCSSLTTVNIPETVESVGVFAFGDYFNHTPWYDNQNTGDVIVGDGILLKHNDAGPTVSFGTDVKKIAYYAFLESKTNTVYFTDSVTEIDPLAMYRSSTTVMLPNGSPLVKELKLGGVSVDTYEYTAPEAEEETEAEETEAEETEAEETEAEETEAEETEAEDAEA